MSSSLDKSPPHAIEAEQAVLGTMLQNTAALGVALESLKPEQFYLPKHRKIFSAIRHLVSSCVAVDLITLPQELTKRAQNEEIGGMSYLIECQDSVVQFDNVRNHIALIIEAAAKNRIIEEANNLIRQAYDHESTVPELVIKQEELLEEVRNGLPDQRVMEIGECVEGVITNLIKINRREIAPGIMSGYSDMDHWTMGFKPGEMIILAARPSVGKTALALNIADNIAIKQDRPVLFISLETSKELITERILASHARLSMHDIKAGKDINDLENTLRQAARQLKNIYIDDPSSIDLATLRSRARKLVRGHKIELLIVDYAQLIIGPKAESRRVEMSKVSNGLKAMGRELGIPCLILSQLRRPEDRGKEKMPQLSDLRETGDWEQDADIVMFLHRTLDKNNHHLPETKWLLSKNKDGPQEVVDLYFNGSLTKFEQIEKRHLKEDWDG